MFSVYGSLEGNASKLDTIECSQLLKSLQIPIFKLPNEDLSISNSEVSEAETDNLVKFAPLCLTIMDQTGRKKYEKSFVPMPDFLVNNPNISIIPATNSNTSPKQHPVPVSSRVSRIVTGSGPVKAVTASAPIKVVPVSTLVNNLELLSKKCADSIENKNGTKRVSSQTPDRGAKKPRISNSKPSPKPAREKLVDPILSEQISKLSAIEINQIIRFDSSSKPLNTNVATSSSTSNSANKVQDSSFQTSQTNSLNINSKVDSANVDAEKMINGTLTKYQFSSDGQFKMNQVYSEETSDSSPTKGQVLEIRTRNTPNDECFTIERTELISHILTIVKSAVKSHVPEENYDTFIQSTKVVQSPEHNRLPEMKNISPNLKLNSANHNNVTTPTHNSNSKHQSTSKDISVKSPRTSNPQKSSPKPSATVQVLTSPKQASTSINSTSKTTNQSDNKLQVTSSQHCAPLKHSMATVTQIQSANKQINKSQQLKAVTTKVVSVTHVPSVSKRLVSLMQVNDKPTITCQSSLQNVKKCIKCNALSDDDVCTTCLMSSQLKGVTVTRIETPGTESTDIIDLDSDKDSDEEETNFSLITEPTITRVETKDQLKKYIEKLTSNPNLLEDKLWQKDLSSKDFFKFDQCHTVQIGSFTTSPVPSGDMIICVYGIRMTINNTSSKAITIDIPTENIIKIYGNYADEPTLIIYTNYLAAFGIQYLLNMNEKDKNCYYDPLSKDDEQKKIILSFDIRKQDVSHLEKLLMKLNGKYEVLTQAVIRSISLRKSLNREKTDKKLQSELADDTVIVRDTLEGRKVAIRVADYKMLTVDEYLNDILIEFHLNRTYMLHLTPENKNQSYVFNTYFYTTLTRKSHTDLATTESKSKIRHDRVKKWTKNVNIFEKNFIFVPINESCHWYMIVICFPNLTGPVYMDDGTPVKTPVDNNSYFENRDFIPPGPDAMKSDCDEADGHVENLRHIDPYYYERIGDSYEEDVENLLQPNFRPIKQPCILVFDSLYGNTHNCCRAKNVATIREWLAEEYRAKYNGAERDFSINVVKGHTVKVPQQTNYTDCGLFVLHFFEKFFKCPIVDYSLPILHLANWFLPDEVQLNCKKRKDVANVIQHLFHEQKLHPPGTVLPTLRFTPPVKEPPPQVIQHPRELVYDDSHDDLENSECGEESNEDYLDDDDYDISENYRSLNRCNPYSGDDDDYDSQDDYYAEMENVATRNRSNIHPNADYNDHPELYEMEQYDNINPHHDNVVNVDDSHNGSMSQRNLHISNTNYGLYGQNNRLHSHNDDEDDVEDLEDEDEGEDEDEDDYSGEGGYDEDEEPSRSNSYPNRHSRHFKRRRLSNE